MFHNLTILLCSLLGLTAGNNINYDDAIEYEFADIEFNESTLYLKNEENASIINFANKRWCVKPDSIVPTILKYKNLGPSVIESLLSSHECTSINVGYWIYEICHGKHVRQYYSGEEIKEKEEKLNFMGYVNDTILDFDNFNVTKADVEVLKSISFGQFAVHAFVAINYTGGDICRSTLAPRNSIVYYVCNYVPEAKIVHINEVHTCSYEIVVGVNIMCPYEREIRKAQSVNVLSCYVDKLPKSDKVRILSDSETSIGDIMKLLDLTFNVSGGGLLNTSKPLTGEDIIPRFYSGDICMIGDSSYWTFIFCFGKFIAQNHFNESTGENVTYSLGRYDSLVNPEDRDVKDPQKTTPTYKLNYIDGNFCEETGGYRSATVDMHCDQSGVLEEYSMVIKEANTCSYHFKVTGNIFCHRP